MTFQPWNLLYYHHVQIYTNHFQIAQYSPTKMGKESSPDRQTSSVGGGTGAASTPANNVGGGAGWGDKVWMGGKEQGIGHADVRDPVPRL
jgi:hypothetical protein